MSETSACTKIFTSTVFTPAEILTTFSSTSARSGYFVLRYWMMKPEANFKKWLIEGLPNGWHGQTIETTTGRGVPDLNLCGSADGKTVEWWLELKAAHNRPFLRPEQFAWMMRRSAVGGKVAVVHRQKDRRWALHLPVRWATQPNSGRYVEVVSQPFAFGHSVEQLTATLLHL